MVTAEAPLLVRSTHERFLCVGALKTERVKETYFARVCRDEKRQKRVNSMF